MDLLAIKDHARSLSIAINGSNEYEEKLPPFLIHRVSEIYRANLEGLHDFFTPVRAVTFSQQVACVVRQSWRVSPEKVAEVVKVLRQVLFSAPSAEREQVTRVLKTIFLRTHGNPFEIAARLLVVEPISESEMLLVNDKRFAFDIKVRIVRRLFSARNELSARYASEYLDFIGGLEDSYRTEERDEVLDLAKKTYMLPYPGLVPMILERLKRFRGGSPSVALRQDIQLFVDEWKKEATDSRLRDQLEEFDTEIGPEALIANYLANPEDYVLFKRLRGKAVDVAPGLLNIVKDERESLARRQAALHALSRFSQRSLRWTITREVLAILNSPHQIGGPVFLGLFDCIKVDTPGLQVYLEQLASAPDVEAPVREKVLSLWSRLYPDSPRPKQIGVSPTMPIEQQEPRAS